MAKRFSLGRLLATPAALDALAASGQTPDFFLGKHLAGDWGEVCDEDRRLNDQALASGDRVLSAYRTLRGVEIWVITEATDDHGNRAATTLLTPDDY